MKKLIISIVVAFTLMLGLLPTGILAATSGSSSGSFSIQHEIPTVNSVALYDSTGVTPETSMTPLTQYQFKVDVTDLNSIGNLTSLNIVLFYLSGTPSWPGPQIFLTGTATSGLLVVPVANTSSFTVRHPVRIADTGGTQSEYNTIASITANTSLTMTTALAHTYTVANNAAVTDFGNMPTTPDSQNCAMFSWTKSSGVWSAVASYPPAAGDSGTTTWSFLSYTAPTDNTASEFVFTGNFIPGKVATAGVGKWYIRARVTDTQNYDSRAYTPAITMNPYDEIDLNTTTLAWGSVVPGMGFGTTPNPKSVTVTYIANGPYAKYVSSNNWTGYTYTATLDGTGGASGTNHFSLQAAIGATTGYVSTVTGPNPYGTLIDDTGVLTYEAGDNFSGTTGSYLSTMSLALNAVFNTDTYSGTIIYAITTR